MNACVILNTQIAFFILYAVLQEALRTRGLKDDTTCVVVDIIPPDNSIPPSTPPKKQNKLRALFRKKSHFSASKLSKKLSAIGIVEELFEEGSAMLAERLVLSFLHSFFHIDFPPAILRLCPIHYTSYSMKSSKFLAEGEETCIMFYQFHIICYHCVNSLTIANKLK